MVIRQIGIASLAKVMGLLYGVMGLIFGGFLAVVSVLGASFVPRGPDEPALIGALFGVGAVVILPIFYAVFGFVFGALIAWAYNIVAGLVGGVMLETE